VFTSSINYYSQFVIIYFLADSSKTSSVSDNSCFFPLAFFCEPTEFFCVPAGLHFLARVWFTKPCLLVNCLSGHISQSKVFFSFPLAVVVVSHTSSNCSNCLLVADDRPESSYAFQCYFCLPFIFY